LLLAIPVIFSPEIRRALERLGRAGQFMTTASLKGSSITMKSINNIVTAVQRLSLRKHGALIIIQRSDNLDEYIKTGVLLNAIVTPELILQVFYPNTPLHDGAAIIQSNVLVAAACVMPLSSSGALDNSPEHRMGLRHRAALGTSEASDATAIVVSEETGSISLAQNGKMIRNLDPARLENILRAFLLPKKVKFHHSGCASIIFLVLKKQHGINHNASYSLDLQKFADLAASFLASCCCMGFSHHRIRPQPRSSLSFCAFGSQRQRTQHNHHRTNS
jgi:diadenylate cyclase